MSDAYIKKLFENQAKDLYKQVEKDYKKSTKTKRCSTLTADTCALFLDEKETKPYLKLTKTDMALLPKLQRHARARLAELERDPKKRSKAHNECMEKELRDLEKAIDEDKEANPGEYNDAHFSDTEI